MWLLYTYKYTTTPRITMMLLCIHSAVLPQVPCKCINQHVFSLIVFSGQSFWLQIQRSRVRFPALPDFLSTSGSGTGSTQPREVNWGAT